MSALPSTNCQCLRWKSELCVGLQAAESVSSSRKWVFLGTSFKGEAALSCRHGRVSGRRHRLEVKPKVLARASIAAHSNLVVTSSRNSFPRLLTQSSSWLKPKKQRRGREIRGAEDDFEVEDAVDYEMDRENEEDDDEGDLRDYETEYDMPMGEYGVQESESFISTEGVEEERVVDYKIDEDEFHKLTLYDCDFFIRRVPDQDDDVFDFREMYVTNPDTDTYAIPKVIGNMPKKPLRCMKSNYEYISVTEPPVDTPRAPLYKTEYQAMKVFLIKHYRNLREDDENFVLDFEEIYVIDSTTRSIRRADVKVEVETGKYRNRSEETLIVRDDGTSFKLIPSELRHTPDEVIGDLQWNRTRENMENYLRGFRDYEISNWF